MAVFGSITNRIFLASTLLATLSIGAAVYFVSARLTRETEDQLQRDLTEAATLVSEQRRTQLENVTRTAHLIADLPKFKAVVDIADRPTLEPIAADYRRQAGADLLLVTGRRGDVLATAGDPPSLPNRLDAASTASDAPTFWPHPSGILQVVTVPVTLGLDRPDVLGYLTVGYLLDAGRAAQFKSLTGADLAFAAGGVVRASTLGPEANDALAIALSPGPAIRATIGGAEYVALTLPLTADRSPNAPAAIILTSRSERMRTLGAIQATLGGVAVFAVVLAGIVSYAVARTITRPLATITNHMRHVAATGDLTEKIAVTGGTGWEDEDARMLASTFNTLTDSIARFQREAGQRDRLSSLGRLSTVIAHEVRNPLMIIKGALRTLTRPGASESDVRDAAADIDEETDRLSRLVTDVLDVARPIRFDPTPTDINAVCRDAAAAASVSGARADVTLHLAPELPTLVTDGERLRTVLVNLLTNAQHAVEAAATAPPLATASRSESVRLTTEPLTGHRVAITVRDRGAGIGSEDLARIFDPYFTTRRAGTGLGLAIAKNIVEGLGGSIGVVTTQGAGTDFRVELGDAPAAR